MSTQCVNCENDIVQEGGVWIHVETSSDHCYAPGGGRVYDEAVATPPQA